MDVFLNGGASATTSLYANIMTSFHRVLVSSALLLGISGTIAAQAPVVEKQIVAPDGIGTPTVFLGNFETFKRNQLASKDPDALTIPLGFVSGHSRSFIGSAGSVNLNLRTGAYSVVLANLTVGSTYSVWFVDQGDLDATSDDTRFLLASLRAARATVSTEGTLDGRALGFTIDNIVVTTDSPTPGNIVASGAINVLQKAFFATDALTVEEARVGDGALTTKSLAYASLVPDIALQTTVEHIKELQQQQDTDGRADGDSPIILPPIVRPPSGKPIPLPIDKLVRQGSKLFFEGTFRGNGRTCGTCHPAHNNLTIDPAFISTLPISDPLFIAENNRLLTDLEKPALMRGFGLILENLDGLDAPTTKFVMRSVPHALGMKVSLLKDSTLIGGPAEMTGWSGDGAPATGSLRDFAIGAVTQHFTRTLGRQEGVDFVLPTPKQLDAMEAFQLSLGRSVDFDLTKLVFQDANVEKGKSIFINGTGNAAAGGRCNVCHTNGGALFAPPDGTNRNLNTNVEDRFHPARSIVNFPIDGGFGTTPNPDGSFGNRAFNTTSLVEAADTPPFFHNNIVGTLEAAVAFYTGPEFSAPRAPAARFSFTPAQISQVSNFLRGLNTLQNIDIARRELAEILRSTLIISKDADSRLATAYNETGDVIKVLAQTNIFPAAMVQVLNARQTVVQAQQIGITAARRRALIQSAITTLDGARRLVATTL